MDIYIAAGYACRDALRTQVLPLLEQAGHTCTSSWLQESHAIKPDTVGTAPAQSQAYATFHAQNDLDDVGRSHALMLLTDEWAAGHLDIDPSLLRSSGGRHVEVGYALAKELPVVVLGPDENVFHRGLCLTAHTFHGALETLQRVAGVLGGAR